MYCTILSCTTLDSIIFSHWPQLYFKPLAYLTVTNNLAENVIRPFVIGQKNWLLCDMSKGTQSGAIVYTLGETAKANGLNPFDYLSFLLNEIRYLGKTPANVFMDITPERKHRKQQIYGKG